MSMAELIKSFHFYFLSNEGRSAVLLTYLDGSIFSIASSVIVKIFLKQHGAQVHYSTPVYHLEKAGEGFMVNDIPFDYCVLCTDVKHTSALMTNADAVWRSMPRTP
jgi:hypothetical protein